ncbi:uncharacterized protein CDV56_105271 [Aspergillus thermomutatus]|uniref:Uncharacterized protein n=1 Tax=Aspergillus thermomutatus TaxID=41047 RepID=A0A397GG15_ASPTH|nr:uncharacterized protein CDV56_105271 [Aspergillus thermomutatus]RHZ48754.1 hypothetical protein CDV56_105271 [Aspergillus thermomutatus]
MAPLSVESAMTKLLHTSRTIQRRNGVRPPEAKRIKHAASLLREGSPPPDAVGAGRQTTYLHFLQKLSGNSMVVLCAVGLGLSAIAIAREDVLLDLPHEINSTIAALDNPVLRRLANEYMGVAERTPPVRSTSDLENSPAAGPLTASHHGPSQNIDQDKVERTIEQRSSSKTNTGGPKQGIGLIGDVYELSLKDVQQIIESHQISGSILLTDTYGVNTTPFVTIPITNELTDRLISNRPRVSWNEP